MTADDFTETANAAAREYASTPRMNVGTVRDRIAVAHMAGAEWAREYLAAQEVTAAEVEAAAQELWKDRALGTIHPHYRWDRLAPELRQSLRELARTALSAARATRRDEETP